MICDLLKLLVPIVPTPHPRVELPQIQTPQELGIRLKVPAGDTQISHGSYEQWLYFRAFPSSFDRDILS